MHESNLLLSAPLLYNYLLKHFVRQKIRYPLNPCSFPSSLSLFKDTLSSITHPMCHQHTKVSSASGKRVFQKTTGNFLWIIQKIFPRILISFSSPSIKHFCYDTKKRKSFLGILPQSGVRKQQKGYRVWETGNKNNSGNSSLGWNVAVVEARISD